MLSPSKILLTLAVIAGVIFATRFLRRRTQVMTSGRAKPKAEPPRANTHGADSAMDGTLDLVRCAICGDYVDATAPACGRADCPPARA